MPELKPCPHCGNHTKPKVMDWDGYGFPGYEVRCDASGWEGLDERGCGAAGGWGETPDEAVTSWNRRTLSTITPAEAGGLVGEWRKAMEGVTPGPWTLIPAREYDGDDDDLMGSYTSPASIEGDDGNPVCTFGSEDGSGTLFENEANHRFVKRCSPDNISALLTALASERAAHAETKRERDEALKALEQIADIARRPK